jgi:hypothetical protein
VKRKRRTATIREDAERLGTWARRQIGIGASRQRTPTTPAPPIKNILDTYTAEAPSAQTALDIFQGEFISAMPAEHPELKAGTIPLFNDDRIAWLASKIDLKGLNVLELGPLEAGHSYMLQQHGVRRVTAVESNSRMFLKCLIIKEIFGLDRVHLLHGDFMEYLRDQPGRFDFCLASGVLYHTQRPVELLSLLASVTDTAFFWTHYYDESVVQHTPSLQARFSSDEPVSHGDLSFTGHRYEYGDSLSSQTFGGGGAAFSRWMERPDILSCLEHLGFDRLDIAFEQTDHPNGPCFAFLAQRT